LNTVVKFLLLKTETSIVKQTIETLTDLYHRHDKIFVLCEQRSVLEQVDEYLWHESHNSFIPYSVEGECTQSSSNVLLSTQSTQLSSSKAMINIGAELPDRLNNLREIIELVKTSEEDKENARQRFKYYRQLGFNVTMLE